MKLICNSDIECREKLYVGKEKCTKLENLEMFNTGIDVFKCYSVNQKIKIKIKKEPHYPLIRHSEVIPVPSFVKINSQPPSAKNGEISMAYLNNVHEMKTRYCDFQENKQLLLVLRNEHFSLSVLLTYFSKKICSKIFSIIISCWSINSS